MQLLPALPQVVVEMRLLLLAQVLIDTCSLSLPQMVVEKQLAAQGRDRRSMGREAFEAEVRWWCGW